MKADKYLKNLVCLYVEDEEDIRESFSLLLKRYFKNLIIAKNGKDGLEKFKENKVDFIISDIRMPVMDGIEMVSKIREIDNSVIIFFITAFSDVEYLQKAIELNVEGYITKPIDKNILISKLNKYANIIKIEKEKKFYEKIINDIFNKIKIPMIVAKENQIILKNNSFEFVLKDKIENIKNLNNKIEIEKDDYKLIFEIEKEKLDTDIELIIFKDVTKYEEEIFVDKLTKVYNRKIIDSVISKMLNEKLCIIILDIDNFKHINDTFGHNVGDIVLQKLGEILKQNTRKDDIVIRWGGEEFIIILNTQNIEIAKNKAELIRKEVENTYIDKVGNFTASFGVACNKIHSYDDLINIIEKADNALYKAKKNGKNRVEIFKS